MEGYAARKAGLMIKLVLTDMDNTLIPWGQSKASPRAMEGIREDVIHRMGRRCREWDYSARAIYLVTVCLKERGRPVLAEWPEFCASPETARFLSLSGSGFCASMRALRSRTVRRAPSGATRGTTSPTDGASTTTGSRPPERASTSARSCARAREEQEQILRPASAA